MNQFLDMIAERKPLLLDGAMGSLLMSAGLTQGESPELWNVTHPDRIREIHRSYIQAGAQLILTNSFGGSRFRLKLHGLQERVIELNQAAAELARAEAELAPNRVVVGGSIGPSGELMEPYGSLNFDLAVSGFAEQIGALAKGGVDVIWIETMSDLQEVKAAIQGARSVTDLPVTATLTFDQKGRTMMGVKPSQAVKELAAYDLAAIGANCGNGPDEIEEVIRSMREENPNLVLIAKANAGIPKWINKQISYEATPEIMAEYALRVRSLGANLIGGCCGNTPEHIRKMGLALKSL